MELLDIYDENGLKTGKVIERGVELEKGEYFFAVHIYIYNKDGQWLIQKRSNNMVNFPGLWEFTSGCVSSGEDSLSAAQREVSEELGIQIEITELHKKGTYRRIKNFVDVWFGRTNCKYEDFRICDIEVAEIKYISQEEMISLVKELPNREPDYKEMVIKEIQKINTGNGVI